MSSCPDRWARATSIASRPEGHDPLRREGRRATCRPSATAAQATGNRTTTDLSEKHIAAALFAGGAGDLQVLCRHLAERDGPIVPIYTAPYPLEFLRNEVSLSTNTAAAGGNASLMTIG